MFNLVCFKCVIFWVITDMFTPKLKNQSPINLHIPTHHEILNMWYTHWQFIRNTVLTLSSSCHGFQQMMKTWTFCLIPADYSCCKSLFIEWFIITGLAYNRSGRISSGESVCYQGDHQNVSLCFKSLIGWINADPRCPDFVWESFSVTEGEHEEPVLQEQSED